MVRWSLKRSSFENGNFCFKYSCIWFRRPDIDSGHNWTSLGFLIPKTMTGSPQLASAIESFVDRRTHCYQLLIQGDSFVNRIELKKAMKIVGTCSIIIFSSFLLHTIHHCTFGDENHQIKTTFDSKAFGWCFRESRLAFEDNEINTRE